MGEAAGEALLQLASRPAGAPRPPAARRPRPLQRGDGRGGRGADERHRQGRGARGAARASRRWAARISSSCGPAQAKRLVARKAVRGAVTSLDLMDCAAIALVGAEESLVREAVPGTDRPLRVKAGRAALVTNVLGTSPGFQAVRRFRVRGGQNGPLLRRRRRSVRPPRRRARRPRRARRSSRGRTRSAARSASAASPSRSSGRWRPRASWPTAPTRTIRSSSPSARPCAASSTPPGSTTVFVSVRDPRRMDEPQAAHRRDPPARAHAAATISTSRTGQAARDAREMTDGSHPPRHRPRRHRAPRRRHRHPGAHAPVGARADRRDRPAHGGRRRAARHPRRSSSPRPRPRRSAAGSPVSGSAGSAPRRSPSARNGRSRLPLGALLASLAMAAVTGLGFGAVPARKASRLPPIRRSGRNERR